MLHSTCQQIWKTQQWPQNWKESVFIPIPKKGNAKICSNYAQLHSFHVLARSCSKSSKLGFKLFIYCMNQSLPDVQDGFRKGLRNQSSNCQNLLDHRISQRIPEKNIYFFDYAKAFDCVYNKKLWKFLKDMRIPDHLTCILRNLYTGQETTVRTGHGKINWFKIGKRVQSLSHV